MFGIRVESACVPKLPNQLSRFFVAPLLRMTLRHRLVAREGEIKMIENSEVAQHISSLMLEMSRKINESISFVKRECSAQEFEAYRKASAKVMGYILLEVLNPIYAAHPDMKPKGLK